MLVAEIEYYFTSILKKEPHKLHGAYRLNNHTVIYDTVKFVSSHLNYIKFLTKERSIKPYLSRLVILKSLIEKRYP